MVPWAEKVLVDNPNLDDIVLPLLRAEIQRLEENQKTQKKASKVKGGNSSCASRKCGFPHGTVNLTNVGVYGTCSRCGKHEHFRCAKIKEEEKEEISKGNQAFFCSGCLFKFPNEIAFNQAVEHITEPPVHESNPTISNSLTHEAVDDIEVVAVIHEEPHPSPALFQCQVCSFRVVSEAEINSIWI